MKSVVEEVQELEMLDMDPSDTISEAASRQRYVGVMFICPLFWLLFFFERRKKEFRPRAITVPEKRTDEKSYSSGTAWFFIDWFP